ncbi:MAG: hypothetical protein HC857_14040 [Synechococcales cyanobacterium RU_4_20]|nr:hypothetical protein [Synechococcales cyanobacterium RU_4_20]
MASSQGFATEVGLQSLSQALLSIIFESEFEGVLQQLEDLLQEDLHKLGSSATTEADLRSELVSLAGELGDLGEMLQLPAFSNLCEAVIEAVDGASCGMRRRPGGAQGSSTGDDTTVGFDPHAARAALR